MNVFLDFEASSLAREGYPIEVAWVFEDRTSESYLIRPAPGWTDWSVIAETIHGIPRATLQTEGIPHDIVARRMVDRLSGHDLFASAPSWDGKWLSMLLRAADVPGHALRLGGTEEAQRRSARTILARHLPPDRLEQAVADAIALAEVRFDDKIPAHRALPDAEEECRRWHAVCEVARSLVTA